MKKNRKSLFTIILCVAGLTTSMLSIARANNTAFSPASLSMLQNEPAGSYVQNLSGVGNAPVAIPTIGSANALNVAFKGYQFNNSLNLPSTPSYSLPVGTITPNAIIPEPSSIACLLLGLGVLIGFRYLKIGSRI